MLAKFWQGLAKYIGLPLARMLVERLLSFISKLWKNYKLRKEMKINHKKNIQLGQNYQDAKDEQTAQDTFNNLP
jgi:hypothetical protein